MKLFNLSMQETEAMVNITIILQLLSDRYKLQTYNIVINFVIILGNLGRVENVEETITFFCFYDWFGIFWSFLWPLLHNLLCQALSWVPLNFRSTMFKQNLTYTANRNMNINPKKLKDIAYPIDFSNIGSSSSIMWYVFVSTEFWK